MESHPEKVITGKIFQSHFKSWIIPSFISVNPGPVCEKKRNKRFLVSEVLNETIFIEPEDINTSEL